MMMFLQICCLADVLVLALLTLPVSQSAIINVFTAIKFLRIMLPGGKSTMVGILDLNCTLYVMNEGKFSTLCLPKPMWMIEMRMSLIG